MLFIIIIRELAVVAQVVEYVIGNDEVPSSNLGNGSLEDDIHKVNPLDAN